MGTLPRPAVLPPLTKRILQVIEDRGLSQVKVSGLAGITGWEWKQRSYTGQWRTSDLVAIARVLRVPVETFTGGVS